MTSDQWMKLINADPIWQQLSSGLGANNASNDAQRSAELGQALASFGGPVDLNSIAKQLGLTTTDLQGLDSATIQQLAKEADQSGVSTSARLDAANTKALLNLKNNLNARGLLRSGEAGYQLGQQNQNYQNAEFDARQKLLSTLQQYQQGYLAAKAQAAAQLAQGGNDAYGRVMQGYGGLTQAQGPQAPAPAPPPATAPSAAPSSQFHYDPVTQRLVFKNSPVWAG